MEVVMDLKDSLQGRDPEEYDRKYGSMSRLMLWLFLLAFFGICLWFGYEAFAMIDAAHYRPENFG